MILNKKDYPFIILAEDKIGKASGKLYQSISVGYTSVKDKTATDVKAKYKTDFLNFFDEKDLLKLAQLCTSAYNQIRLSRGLERKEKMLSKGAKKQVAEDRIIEDDEIPF